MRQHSNAGYQPPFAKQESSARFKHCLRKKSIERSTIWSPLKSCRFLAPAASCTNSRTSGLKRAVRSDALHWQVCHSPPLIVSGSANFQTGLQVGITVQPKTDWPTSSCSLGLDLPAVNSVVSQLWLQEKEPCLHPKVLPIFCQVCFWIDPNNEPAEDPIKRRKSQRIRLVSVSIYFIQEK